MDETRIVSGRYLDAYIRINFDSIIEEIMDRVSVELFKKYDDRAKVLTKDIFSMRIRDLELETRTINCLSQNNIFTIADLISLTEKEILKMKNVGRKTLSDINRIIVGYNITLKK